MHEDNEEVFHQHIDKVITTGSNKDIFVVLNDWNDKVAYQPKVSLLITIYSLGKETTDASDS